MNVDSLLPLKKPNLSTSMSEGNDYAAIRRSNEDSLPFRPRSSEDLLEMGTPPEYQRLMSPQSASAVSTGTGVIGPTLRLPLFNTDFVTSLQSLWTTALSSDARREVEAKVTLLLDQAEAAQHKGEQGQALLLLEAADGGCNGRLSYREWFFSDEHGQHQNPLLFALSRGDNQPIVLSLLKVAVKAKHFFHGSLFARSDVYDQKLGVWLEARGAECRRLLLAGQDEAACAHIEQLNEVLLAARRVSDRLLRSLCHLISPQVSPLEIATQRGCVGAKNKLTGYDPVGWNGYLAAKYELAAQALEVGDLAAAEELYDALVAQNPQSALQPLVTQARAEQFVRRAFAAEALREVEKAWSDQETRVLDQGDSKKRHTELFEVCFKKYAVAIDVERDPIETHRWLRLVLKFGMDASSLTFGHDDFSDRENIRLWLNRGTKNGRYFAHTTYQARAYENNTADQELSLLRLFLQYNCFAGSARFLGKNFDAKLVELVRTCLKDTAFRPELLEFLRETRDIRPQAAPYFLPLTLDMSLRTILPADIHAWIEQG